MNIESINHKKHKINKIMSNNSKLDTKKCQVNKPLDYLILNACTAITHSMIVLYYTKAM